MEPVPTEIDNACARPGRAAKDIATIANVASTRADVFMNLTAVLSNDCIFVSSDLVAAALTRRAAFELNRNNAGDSGRLKDAAFRGGLILVKNLKSFRKAFQFHGTIYQNALLGCVNVVRSTFWQVSNFRTSVSEFGDMRARL